MPAKVFAVGQTFPGDVAEYVPFRSDKSLFDADLIIFTPTFAGYKADEHHAGKPVIREEDSAAVIQDCRHWRNEIGTAVNSGKVVIVNLTKPADAYYDTGRRTFSGSGRSRVTTRQIDAASSYDSIPLRLEGLVPKRGTEISAFGDLGAFAVYWNAFGARSEYEVYFDAKGVEPILGTKKREKVVGALVRSAGGGALVLLPPVKWDEASLTYTRGETTYWRKEATIFGNQLLAALVGVSDALRRQGKRTPAPDWVATAAYSLPVEDRLRAEAAELDRQMVALGQRRTLLQKDVEEAGELRALLFESGKPLEGAILKALRAMGFQADPYRDADSEFDAVFASPEGRFIGEAEGKDAKAVNIDKMSQLERNLQEDFAREGVTDYAKGVLFGNAFRLQAPTERDDFFTEKCIKAAQRLGVALVRTPDLFGIARHLAVHDDPAYATACRQAIFAAKGTVVTFPPTPDDPEANA